MADKPSSPKRGTPKAGTKKSVRKPDARNHFAYKRWAIDYDYVKDLSPEDQAWMAQFTDEFYGCDFRWEEPMYPDRAGRRERMVNQNRMARDVTTQRAMAGMLKSTNEMSDRSHDSEEHGVWTHDAYHPNAPGAPDLGPTPGYQADLDYRSALVEYRKLVDVPPKRKGSDEPGLSPQQRARLELLQAYLRSHAPPAPYDEDPNPEDE